MRGRRALRHHNTLPRLELQNGNVTGRWAENRARPSESTHDTFGHPTFSTTSSIDCGAMPWITDRVWCASVTSSFVAKVCTSMVLSDVLMQNVLA